MTDAPSPMWSLEALYLEPEAIERFDRMIDALILEIGGQPEPDPTHRAWAGRVIHDPSRRQGIAIRAARIARAHPAFVEAHEAEEALGTIPATAYRDVMLAMLHAVGPQDRAPVMGGGVVRG